MTTLSRPSASRGPLATPSPSYNINFGYDFGAAFSGSEKVVAVSYLARANRRGRITAAWFMPNTGTGGYYLYGFVGKVSGDVAARTNGVQKYQYRVRRRARRRVHSAHPGARPRGRGGHHSR